MGRSRLACTTLVLALLIGSGAGFLHPDDVILQWNPNTERDLAGYTLFYGTRSGEYIVSISTGRATEWTVRDLEEGQTYYFALKAFDASGQKSDFSEEVSCVLEWGNEGAPKGLTLSGVENKASQELPKRLALGQNYPNPSNPSTTIKFDVPVGAGAKEHVGLFIYNVRGRLVKRLIDLDLAPGSYRVVWDGTDDRGAHVASGIYLCSLSSRGKRLVKKLTIVR